METQTGAKAVIDPADKKTQSLPMGGTPVRRGRGRPSTGKALTPAQKQKAYRERVKAQVEALKAQAGSNVTANSIIYMIKSAKGYWLAGGLGYTKSKAKAGRFSWDEMQGLNLDGCTLERP